MNRLPIKIKLPEHFLEEEVRCEYTISSDMKSVWAVELDLLNEFKEVCSKNNIQWWMDSGSLLGTVRHKGFIPWDDDIDVILFRKDYDKLCEIASNEFKQPYFFQTELTDHCSMRGHAQLRNSLTTGILKCEQNANYRFNQGIFIDIFPLDAIPDDECDVHQMLERLNNLKRDCYKRRSEIHCLCHMKRRNFVFMLFDRIKGYLLNTVLYDKYGNRTNYVRFENEARKYMDEQTKLFGNLILGTFDNNKALQIDCFKETVYLPFEFILVPIPIGYERILSALYRDWKVPVKGGSLHGGVIFDAYRPYTQYLK